MPGTVSSPATLHSSLWGRFVARFGRGGAAMLAVLALLFITSVTFAVKAEKPWGRTVQKRLEKKMPLTPKEYAVIGLWWGSVANAGLLALLLGAAGKWMPRSSNAGLRPAVPADFQSASAGTKFAGRKPVLLALLLAAVALAAWMRAPRLSHSLWNDEEYAMRKFAHGAWEHDGVSDSWRFEPASWTETLFENRNGNNHLLNSLITRVALDTWRLFSGAPRDAFSEAALRTPALIAGLLTIVMIYLLGCRIGGPVAGIGAAFILALCPWHVRYAVEAKGYSFMLLFVCTAIYSMIRAIEENRLLWWLAFALSEAAFILSFAGSAYVAMALNLFAAFELIKTRRASRLWTLIAFNVLAAIPVVQWMLPSVPQMLAYLDSEKSLHLDLGWPFLRDFFSGLAIGLQYDNPGQHAGTSWLMQTAAHAWLAPAVWVVGAILITGIVFSFVQNTATRLAIAAPMAAVAAAYLQNYLSGTPMVVWYLVYVILPASLALPLGVLTLKPRRIQHPWANIAVLTATYGLIAVPAAMLLRDHPRQPMREAVAFVRLQDKDATTGVFGVSDKQLASYDPHGVVLESADDLRGLVRSASQTRHPLFVYVCGQLEAERRNPELMHIIDPGLQSEAGREQGDAMTKFKLVAEFPGTEAMFSYRVYRADKAWVTKQ